MALRNPLAEYWARRKAKQDEAKAAGTVMITLMGGRLQVATPYPMKTFAIRAKELGGRWRYRSRLWSFPIAARRLVFRLLYQTYGKKALLKPGQQVTDNRKGESDSA